MAGAEQGPSALDRLAQQALALGELAQRPPRAGQVVQQRHQGRVFGPPGRPLNCDRFGEQGRRFGDVAAPAGDKRDVVQARDQTDVARPQRPSPQAERFAHQRLGFVVATLARERVPEIHEKPGVFHMLRAVDLAGELRRPPQQRLGCRELALRHQRRSEVRQRRRDRRGRLHFFHPP